ncbi:hypothetical protein [Pseudotabrizicola alkalilacus]|uniref:Uncharacterized protein n=1 Tax=Pseudotabrizicola alkalilacus TaxID=2305252 RepID=A0A411Z4E8_9RHOB|nr:hypothetical protein [Pseudotabrizicola alkalilacus]RGP37933.1 hypothetical protein D1012_08600 [Pseudotabrizicola alkalilacus]
MKLILSPVRMDTALTASVSGSTLTLNGEALDFGPLPNGALLPREAIDSPWIAGDVSRDMAGVLTVPLILPHGASAPEETLFPAPLTVTSGPVALPPYQIEEIAHAED